MAEIITTATSTITTLVGSVYDLMTANSLCTIFLGASLLGVGFLVFRRIKGAAKG